MTLKGEGGFHHHATMSIAIYGFSISERGAFPPGSIAKILFSEFALPKVYDREAPPLRPERHVPNSIATCTVDSIVKLVANLSRSVLHRGNVGTCTS